MKTILAVFPLVLAACGGSNGPPAQKPPVPAIAALMLDAEPGNALGIVAAKAKGPGSTTVTGRIHDISKGSAVFKLMDVALPYCGEKNKEDNCPTPWDYCCDKPQIAANSLLVEVRDADGKAVATPSLGDLRLLDRVTVMGKLERDEYGNFVLLAGGWFRNDRPKLPDYVKWPQ